MYCNPTADFIFAMKSLCTPRGDLAGDMKHEEAGFPKDGDRQRILDYLDGMFACDECIALFKRCWRDYEKAVADEGK